jgi:hypothetical protein
MLTNYRYTLALVTTGEEVHLEAATVSGVTNRLTCPSLATLEVNFLLLPIKNVKRELQYRNEKLLKVVGA